MKKLSNKFTWWYIKNTVVKVINKNKLIKTTAKKYKINKMILSRYIIKYKNKKNTNFYLNLYYNIINLQTKKKLRIEYLLTSVN